MRIEEIDKNLLIETTITEDNLVWLDAKEPPFSLFGVFHDEESGYLRMPQKIAAEVSDSVAHLNRCTAGGRVRFQTDSSFIAIKAVMKNEILMPHITLAGQSGFDLYRNVEGKDLYYHSFVPPMGVRQGYTAFRQTDGKLAQYTLNFPLYDNVCELYIALKKDAVILPATAYAHPLPVVYYGSSITQGGCVSRPGNSYQAILSRMLDVDHINLGFSGSCRAEPAMAEYLAQLPMSVFVCDYDHNAPDEEHLRATHLPLYRTIRAKQPDLPILFISAPDSISSPAFSSRRDIVRYTYETSVKEGDTRTRFIDGGELFAGECWDACTVDGCHPNDLGFFRMSQRIGRELKDWI